jgi:hypothetical protein
MRNCHPLSQLPYSSFGICEGAILVISVVIAPQTGTEFDVMTRCCGGGWLLDAPKFQLRILDAVRIIYNTHLILYAMIVADPGYLSPSSTGYLRFLVF